jgi:hypothetical protein
VITVGADDIDGSVSTNDDYTAAWSACGYTLDGFAKPDIAAPGRASASWASASWSDNAEGEAPSEEGEYLSDAELQEFAADLGIVDPVAETGDSADTITSPLP